jgi:hypothetical protein
MSTRNIYFGLNVDSAKSWQSYHFCVSIFLKSGSLSILEPSGSVQACNGIAFNPQRAGKRVTLKSFVLKSFCIEAQNFPHVGLSNFIVHSRIINLQSLLNNIKNTRSPIVLTLSLLMSYIYGAPCKDRNFNVIYIYGPTFDKAESRLFLFAAQCFNIESMQKVFLWHSCI